jgi:hypothetical protein
VVVGLAVTNLEAVEIDVVVLRKVQTTGFLTDWALSRRLPAPATAGPANRARVGRP